MLSRFPVNHCRVCGTQVQHRVPDDGDTRVRAVCPACHTIHYENPLNVVGTVPVWGDTGEQVLLCKRNIEPRKGKWTLPAGFMELDETTAQGAARETDEEAGASIELQDLFTVMNVVRVGQVHLFYRARLLSSGGGDGEVGDFVALAVGPMLFAASPANPSSSFSSPAISRSSAIAGCRYFS